MSPQPVLIEVADLRGNVRTHRVDPIDPDPQVVDLVEQLVTTCADELGRHPEDIAVLLAGLLVERIHDEAAYERVAARRGVLAL